ncbi:hypothetical protein L3X38_004361 [Prunus dulcis]|uniref:Reverse transcriptase/retrotransposon-derived protein RNase H-like domain-containing protein n=1 Tax=Prunus dulcis TaxID=3755 RepID=A0AAD5F364_PRUDU|nr:hypothetical protein L3X38_004361 [Prunus dulcis]
MPAYGKFFKELNTYKRKYGPNEKVMVSENVSAVLQRKLPPKLKDPGRFSINITIGDKLVENAMLDLGASINLVCLTWVFMDDFSVFGDSFDQCLHNLSKVLARCEHTNLVLNWEKCHFMVDQGIVLGHVISSKGIEVDKAKIDLIASMTSPTSVKEVRSFIGHAGFYRRFIQDFSKIARPMCNLLAKDMDFVFDQDCENAFNALKKMLTTAPIIIPPDWSLPFELMCDASDYAVGAVLGQRVVKKPHAIYYASL